MGFQVTNDGVIYGGKKMDLSLEEVKLVLSTLKEYVIEKELDEAFLPIELAALIYRLKAEVNREEKKAAVLKAVQ